MPPKNTKNKKVRINFRLPTYLDDLFTQEAKRQGIPKSKLLRKWIVETNSLELKKSPTPTKKTTYFHFNLTPELKAQIEKSANEFNLDISNYLRILVASKLTSNSHSSTNSEIISSGEARRLWLSGRLEELDYRVKKNFEEVSSDIHFLHANVSLDLSNEENARESISILKRSRYGNKYEKEKNILRAMTLEADIALSHNDTNKTKSILDEIQSNPSTLLYRHILGAMHFHLGKYYTKEENIQKAHENYSASLEYYDLLSHPLEIVRTYNFIAHMSKFEVKNEIIAALFERAKTILDTHNNHYEQGWFYSQLAAHEYTWGNHRKSEDLLNEGIKLIRTFGSSKQIYMNRSILGRLFILKGEYNKAYSVLTNSISEELKFRPKPGSSVLYMHFIESLDNYEQSKINLEQKMLEESSNTYSNVREYILYTMQYLHGPTYEERESGAKNLIKLSVEGKYPQIREACQKTLQERKLQPTAV